MRQPLRCKRTGLWLARYTTDDGTVRQVGRHRKKSVAQQMIIDAIAADEGRPQTEMTVVAFLEQWPLRFPRHPRTEATNRHRIRRYILPYLPKKGEIPLVELRRAQLRDVQEALLREGLAKRTVDHAFSSLSAMLKDAIDDELLDANPAHGFRVRPGDPRLRPIRKNRPLRAVPVSELAAFHAALDESHRALLLTPLLTGVRPAELFAMNRNDVDREQELIYLHKTATRYGGLENGLKTTHHLTDREERGRWTLFPSKLFDLVSQRPPHIAGWLFTAPRGGLWGQRNFYRDVWEPARDCCGLDLTIYDLRHTFSSRLLAAGIPLVEVSGWMGHSLRAGGELVNTTSTTYAHATGEHRLAALAELTRLYYAVSAQTPKSRRLRPSR
jgi:integrase